MAFLDDSEPVTCTDCGTTLRILCPHVQHRGNPVGYEYSERVHQVRETLADQAREHMIRAETGQLDDEWERLQTRREHRQAMTGKAERLVGGLPRQRCWPGY